MSDKRLLIVHGGCTDESNTTRMLSPLSTI